MPAEDRYEVIVVGGGGAGLAAATAAAQSGCKTLLVERRPALGGTTAISTGLVSAAGTWSQRCAGIADDTPERHCDDMLTAGQAQAERNSTTLTRLLAEEAPATVDWLAGLGVTFGGPFPSPGASRDRMLVPLPNAGSYIFHLARAFRRAGGVLRLGAAVDDLIVEEGRVTGVVSGSRRITATRGIILASGDFSAHKALRHAHLPQYDAMPAINPHSVGTGFELGLKLGGEILNGDIVRAGQLRFPPPEGQGSLVTRLPPHRWLAEPMRLALKHLPKALLKPVTMPFLATYLTPDAALFRQGAILLNAAGERFTDETKAPGLAVSRQPKGQAHIVFDAHIAAHFDTPPNAICSAPGVAHAYLRDFRRYRPDLVTSAASPEALAQALGMPPERLSASLPEGWAPGPLYALGPVRPAISTTMGGLRVDENLRVLRAGGAVVPGLYAAGSVGYGGLVIVGQGNNLGWAFTAGRRAGLNVARDQRNI
ncbi:FAD-dependent oxidoreductase [Salipiger abyssi]|uniref:Fumarate reductase flavoprotein subunit n=1 Tax=Salipiger abyssi TaxID=1250539 RepID=A0A1P8UMP6_9RHOB|nr:FAD-dependent oxidoreductase [Salipiger abyssi]APZ50672.1 fumarate reductase flavoprotein subunit [Salipiger abyssi]